MSEILKIAVTPGEPAGIGPDLIIILSQQHWDASVGGLCGFGYAARQGKTAWY